MKTVLPLLILVVFSCKTNNKVCQTKDNTKQDVVPLSVPGPKALVYKTKADYCQLVPVMLSDDKSKVVSYPDPKDVKIGDVFQAPVKLHKDYLFDKRGIGKNVAFLKMTFEEYFNLQKVPTTKELYDLIIDKDPLKELIDCGNLSKINDPENYLNQLIDNGKIRTTCKVIK
jgi:hypothetical protein